MKNDTAQMINCIYRATEGEGIFVGRPQVFVRYQGCAIGCVNCDSKDTWNFLSNPTHTTEEIINKVIDEGFGGKIKFVSITGGDPLHPKLLPGVIELARELKNRSYGINIEAAGSRVVEELFDLVDFISFDIKTPSTNVHTPYENIRKLVNKYADKAQIKSVIYDRKDFDEVLRIRRLIEAEFHNSQVSWVLTPCYNTEEVFPMDRFKEVISWNEEAAGLFRVIGQQHKWIHGPDKKQV